MSSISTKSVPILQQFVTTLHVEKKQPVLSEMDRKEGKKKHGVPLKGKLEDLD